MADAVNILEDETGRRYESVELRGQTCIQCNCNFSTPLHAKKRKFKKREFSFYRLCTSTQQDDLGTHYLHTDCLVALLKSPQYSDDKRLSVVNGDRVTRIDHCDRFGVSLTKVNYVKRLETILQKHYTEKCRRRFLKQTRPLFTAEQNFPRTYYRFNGDRKEFERVKKKCVKKYAKKGVTVTLMLTPEDVTRAVSR